MATRYIGIAATDGIQVINGDVVGAASGGTLTGSQVIQVVFDDTEFDATLEGKQRLIAGVKLILDRIASAREYPITSSS